MANEKENLGLLEPRTFPKFVMQTESEESKVFLTENAKQVTIRKRKLFEAELLSRGGPSIIPTICKDHPQRYLYVREQRQLMYERNPCNPPPEPLNLFSFPDDIYENILSIFKQKDFRTFIKPAMIAKIIHLNKESCEEQAFQEMLSSQPNFYSDDKDTVVLSQYVNKDFSQWVKPPVNCQNFFEFVVDFSMIFPKGQTSSALVMCCDCGKMVETVLCDNVIEMAKKDMWQNICNREVVFENSDPLQYVIQLPTRGSVIDSVPFVKGLMGVTTLTKNNPVRPSIFVRTRLYYFVNTKSNFSSVIHDSMEDEDEDGLPSHS